VKKSAKAVMRELQDTEHCLDLIKEELAGYGVRMDSCPPMFYPEAIHNLFAWTARASGVCQKKHGWHGNNLARVAGCIKRWIQKHQAAIAAPAERVQTAPAAKAVRNPYTEPVEKDGDLMTRKEYVDCCKVGGFVDDDGYGYAVKRGKMAPSIVLSPSKVDEMPKEITHVVWFNR